MNGPAPLLVNTVLDAVDIRELAEFYRRLLGWSYRAGDEPSDGPEPDWLILRHPAGGRIPGLAFQQVERLPPTTWPQDGIPQQLHLDFVVADPDQLRYWGELAAQLGARLLLDRSDDPQEELMVYADPAGHPFCLFVG